MINDAVTREMDLAKALANKAPSPTPQASQGFDRFMADLENRNRNALSEARTRNNPAGSRRDGREERADMPADKNRDAFRNTRETPVQQRDCRPDDTETAAVEAGVAADDMGYGQEQLVDKEMDEVIVYALAEVVKMPPDVMYEAVKALAIKPEELVQPSVANKYLQHLLNVESPVELLTLPEYPDALKQVTEAVEEILKTAAPVEAKLDLARLSGLAVTVEEENKLVVTLTEDAEVASMAEEDDLSQMMGRNDRQTPSREGDTAQTAQTAQTVYEAAAPVVMETPEVFLPDANTAAAETVVNPASVTVTQTAAVNAAMEVTAGIRIEPAQVMEQIMAKVKTITAENFAELRITLRPEQLGDVTLRVAIQNGVVMAMFVAESQRIKEIIEANFNLLRDALEEQGIEVADLFVSVDSGDAEEQMNQYLKARQEAMRRLQQAAGVIEVEEEPEAVPIHLDNTVDFIA